MYDFDRILVPIDFSPCSKLALRHALELASRFDASLELVHVWTAPSFISHDTIIMTPNQPGESVRDWLRKGAERAMTKVLDEMELTGRADVRTRLEEGDPHLTISRIAEEDGIELIVMGTHGRTGLAHALMGSVAEKVVRTASCPVLTVREPREAKQKKQKQE